MLICTGIISNVNTMLPHGVAIHAVGGDDLEGRTENSEPCHNDGGGSG